MLLKNVNTDVTDTNVTDENDAAEKSTELGDSKSVFMSIRVILFLSVDILFLMLIFYYYGILLSEIDNIIIVSS